MSPVQKSVWYIECFLHSELSLERLARAVGVSPCHLTRAFGAATGRSVMRYVRHRRLSWAATQLAAGRQDLLDLALELGYQSHGAFSRAFREQFGLSPDRIRRQGHVHTINLQEPLRMEASHAVELAEPHFVDHPGMRIAGLSRHYSYESSAQIPGQWAEFNALAGTFAGRSGDDAFGVISEAASDGSFEYLTGVPVTSLSGVDDRMAVLTLAPQRYAVFSSSEHVAALRAVMHAIWSSWLPRSGVRVSDAPMLERYGASFDPATGSGGFELWIPLASD
ncbi:MAG: AraC family transcriptional regulator [Pseudomonadales bacterium]